jgi:hypothetical protein
MTCQKPNGQNRYRSLRILLAVEALQMAGDEVAQKYKSDASTPAFCGFY